MTTIKTSVEREKMGPRGRVEDNGGTMEAGEHQTRGTDNYCKTTEKGKDTGVRAV